MALWNDARFALRQLRKSPGFTLIVLVTLALCIGVNTAIFSVLDAVLFRQAPFPQPERLALLETVYRGRGGEEADTSQTGALYEAVRDRASLLDCAAWAQIGGANFAEGDRSEYVQQQRVSSGYFRVMGIPPAIEFTQYGYWPLAKDLEMWANNGNMKCVLSGNVAPEYSPPRNLPRKRR